jgi:hypothetical protein
MLNRVGFDKLLLYKTFRTDGSNWLKKYSNGTDMIIQYFIVPNLFLYPLNKSTVPIQRSINETAEEIAKAFASVESPTSKYKINPPYGFG